MNEHLSPVGMCLAGATLVWLGILAFHFIEWLFAA